MCVCFYPRLMRQLCLIIFGSFCQVGRSGCVWEQKRKSPQRMSRRPSRIKHESGANQGLFTSRPEGALVARMKPAFAPSSMEVQQCQPSREVHQRSLALQLLRKLPPSELVMPWEWWAACGCRGRSPGHGLLRAGGPSQMPTRERSAPTSAWSCPHSPQDCAPAALAKLGPM